VFRLLRGISGFERVPTTSAVHLKADIRLRRDIRRDAPMSAFCGAEIYPNISRS
jgi:hypothetical protein